MPFHKSLSTPVITKVCTTASNPWRSQIMYHPRCAKGWVKAHPQDSCSCHQSIRGLHPQYNSQRSSQPICPRPRRYFLQSLVELLHACEPSRFSGMTSMITNFVIQLNYHLYAPSAPYPQKLLPYQRNTHHFFMSDNLREELQRKQEATLQTLPASKYAPELE